MSGNVRNTDYFSMLRQENMLFITVAKGKIMKNTSITRRLTLLSNMSDCLNLVANNDVADIG